MSFMTILGLTGLTLILVRGEIFLYPRERLQTLHRTPQKTGWWLRLGVAWLHAVFTCPQCSGFWVGVFGQTVHSLLHGNLGWTTPFDLFIAGGLVSILTIAVDLALSVMATGTRRQST